MVTLSQLWWTFLWLGCTGFGGGVAVLAQIHSTVVVNRGWLTESEFWEAAAFGQSLPGSPSANAIGYIGLRLQGVPGALLAFSSFILPSFFLMLAFAMGYRQLQKVPDTARIFFGLNAAVVGLIFAVSVKLGRRALTEYWHWLIAALSCISLLWRFATVVEVVLVTGIIGIFINFLRRRKAAPPAPVQKAKEQPRDLSHSPDLPLSREDAESRSESVSETEDQTRLFSLSPILLLASGMALFPLLVQLASVFLRVGAVAFGGGFAMIPLIEEEVVNRAAWLGHREFVDGMALGQITPGPVLITATFVGYYVAGVAGAIIATISVFLPSFILVLIAGKYLTRMRTNPQVAAFLQGVLPAVVGMMAVALVSLAKSGIHSMAGALLAGACAAILLVWRISPALVMLGAAIFGLFLQYLFPSIS
jgi:chromate transporter